jgi:lipopolysaccharide transport system ATP-binding protein
MAAIEFDGVWKKFHRGERHDSLRDLIPSIVRTAIGRSQKDELGKDDFWVLRDVSFKIEPGEALGIVGQNGAGKSTTLKLLTKILKPTRGSCIVRGRVGALIEVAAGFHPDLTGRENVYLQGAIMGMRREEIRRHFDEIVEFAQLAEFIDTPVKRYSSGMNARLGFSIAAHLEPDVLLIDEVLAVGDFSFQQKCYDRLRQFRRRGTTIAFVSHNMQAISAICDNALFLKRGLPPTLGPTSDVIAAYANSQAVQSADPRISIEVCQLHTDNGTRTHIGPGSQVQLAVLLKARVPFSKVGVGFEVVRADGTVIFNGGPMLDGAQSIDLAEGATLGIQVAFRANVLRGVYMINLYLADERRVWPSVALYAIESFVVQETTRVSGCAELSPHYTLNVSNDVFGMTSIAG